jgi:hypothetical protein
MAIQWSYNFKLKYKMKKFLLLSVFATITMVSFGSTKAVVPLKLETKTNVSEKLVTYKIDNPIAGQISISVSERALINYGSFPVYYDLGNGITGSFMIDFGSNTTMDDIIKIILDTFFNQA